MFLTSWTSTRSRAERSFRGYRRDAASRGGSATSRESDLDGDARAQRRLAGLPPHANHDLEGAARGVDGRADELDLARRLRFGEPFRHDLDLVSHADAQEPLFTQIDAREQRIGRGDLEEGSLPSSMTFWPMRAYFSVTTPAKGARMTA